MMEQDFLSVRSGPPEGVTLRRACPPKASPKNDRRRIESQRQLGERGRMPERVGTIQHRRRLRAECPQRSTSREQIAHQAFAARNELVGKHEPRSRLELSRPQRRRQIGRTLRPNLEIVLHYDGLSVEEKTLPLSRQVFQQLVDQRDEPLPKALGGVIPLAVPVGVRDDVNAQREG